MRCLKSKKQLQAQYDKLSAQINNTETMVYSLENAVSDVETLKAQQLAASTMKDVYKATGGIEKVDNMLDDIRDTMDRANELSDALSQQLGGNLVDEDEIEDELAALEEETLDKQLDAISSEQIGKMRVPTGPIASAKTKKSVHDEFADLEAELNA
jgi:charged multivesicular body protein 4